MKREPSRIVAAMNAKRVETPKPWPETVYVGFAESTEVAFVRHVAKHGPKPQGLSANLQFVTGTEPEEAPAKAVFSTGFTDVVRGREKRRGLLP